MDHFPCRESENIKTTNYCDMHIYTSKEDP